MASSSSKSLRKTQPVPKMGVRQNGRPGKAGFEPGTTLKKAQTPQVPVPPHYPSSVSSASERREDREEGRDVSGPRGPRCVARAGPRRRGSKRLRLAHLSVWSVDLWILRGLA